MKRNLLLLSLLISMLHSQAQEQPSLENIADRRFERFEFVVAAPLYEQIVKDGKVKPQVYYKLGYCYEMMQQYEKAVATYQTFLKRDTANPALWMRVGDMQKILKRYDEARVSYNNFSSRTHKPELVARRIAGCDSAKVWLSDTTKPLPLVNEKLLNTDVSDWGVSFYGNKLVFTSDHTIDSLPMNKKERARNTYGRNGHAFLKLYQADTVAVAAGIADSANFIAADFKPGGANFEYHVGPAVFSKNLDTVYFTITNDGNNLEYEKALTRSVGTRKLEIYYCVKNSNNEWGAPVAFAYNNVKSYSVGHAALAKDGSRLYFASDMPGGFGGTDIWFCEKKNDGGWYSPINCGSVINTPGQEVFPTIVADTTLYFSSNEHPGMGGLDLFYAYGTDSAWQTPVNMKLPFNSSYDDFYCNIQKRKGFLASDREGGSGSDDIYSFEIPPVYFLLLDNTVYNRKDSTILKGAQVQLTCSAVTTDTTATTDGHGNNTFVVKRNQQYIIRAAYPGFTSASIDVPTTGYKDIDTVYSRIYLAVVPPPETIPVKPPVIGSIPDRHFEIGETFVLDKLYYDTDKHNIRPDAAKELDKLVAILMKYPKIEIELSSHTDSRGSDQHNLVLSQNRAKSAVQYLISKGVAASRLIAAGYGETRLTNRCANGVKCTSKEHQMNRRTEVKILKN
ncbi:Outer membrane protein OmpA [Filimonas lacunae]|uniref:Outer membrane protein OmpA n=1 Tax=Filimonas lacunae TaxID=477680 RepID=A0A173MMR5_9BACT|nr:OmpA family protein [Filimonas lacunae]BAV08691.1 outer membrane lipoprotein omp16 precursor [Filimonas lacunae]SIS60036.1 Outer membrane protein OmpA [Filimonas lacunae]